MSSGPFALQILCPQKMTPTSRYEHSSQVQFSKSFGPFALQFLCPQKIDSHEQMNKVIMYAVLQLSAFSVLVRMQPDSQEGRD